MITDEAQRDRAHGGHDAERGAGAIARARPRAALVEACALREASERGQKRVRRLHGLLRTAARGPAKDGCPLHNSGADPLVASTPPH